MKIVKVFCGRRLGSELVFLCVGRKANGFHALIEGEDTAWSDGPFPSFAVAETRLKEQVASLGMSPDLSSSVIACVDAGHRTDEGKVVGFSRDQLADIFGRAKAAESPKDADDGDTCNGDMAAFRVDGVPAALIMGAAEQAGVSVVPFERDGGERWYWFNVTGGQASMEAATNALKEGGLTAAMCDSRT